MASTSAKAVASLSTMGLGVAPGASKPDHMCTSYWGMPTSANVGTSGSVVSRRLPATANALSLPLFSWGAAPLGISSVSFTSPDNTLPMISAIP